MKIIIINIQNFRNVEYITHPSTSCLIIIINNFAKGNLTGVANSEAQLNRSRSTRRQYTFSIVFIIASQHFILFKFCDLLICSFKVCASATIVCNFYLTQESVKVYYTKIQEVLQGKTIPKDQQISKPTSKINKEVVSRIIKRNT